MNIKANETWKVAKNSSGKFVKTCDTLELGVHLPTVARNC
jgi:hypothetical protein